jgi:SagB-type dehydrogenase family enzyme
MVSVIPDRFATRPVTAPPVPAAGLRPSPHMLLRHEAGLWMAEQPGLGVVVRFHDPTAVRLLTDWPALHPADLDEGERAVVAALLDNGLLTPITSSVQPRSVSPEDLWEFHDYYFHHRARPGHYHAKYGGTYRFLDEVDPPPVVKAAMSEDRVPLAEGEPLAMPFGKVRAQRRSVRHDDGPLTVVELGEFLGHVARLRGFANSTHDQVSRRNYPGGGARYELEIYPLVHDVEGLPAGSYHYDPQAHELERIGNATAAVQASLAFAGRVATRRTPPRVLFVITARIGRVSWKYESIAYSLVLKHVGVLYSVMYDTATAMGLSPCALGAGNLDYYALATTTDPILEPAVGEFILGGAPMAMPDLRAR